MTESVEAIPGWVLWVVCPERTRLAVTVRINKVASRLQFVGVWLTCGIVAIILRHEATDSIRSSLWVGVAMAVIILSLAALILGARRHLDRAAAWGSLAALPRTAPERFYERTRILRTGISAQLAWLIILASAIVFLLVALGFLMSHGLSL